MYTWNARKCRVAILWKMSKGGAVCEPSFDGFFLSFPWGISLHWLLGSFERTHYVLNTLQKNIRNSKLMIPQYCVNISPNHHPWYYLDFACRNSLALLFFLDAFASWKLKKSFLGSFMCVDATYEYEIWGTVAFTAVKF